MMNAKTLTALFLLLAVGSFAQNDEDLEYGQNQITISPLSAYGSDQFGDLGLGLAYERFVNEKVAIYSPLSIGLSNEMLQAGVGIKLYPSGHETPVSYSIAPLFLFTTGKEEYYDYGLYDNIVAPREERIYQLGFLLLNSLNITIDNDIYLGVEGGFGVNYLTEWDDNRNRYEDGPSLNGVFRVNMGYRF
jgi:hypothetical protein